MQGCGAHIVRLTALWATCIAMTSCASQKATHAPILTTRHSLTLPAWSIRRGSLMPLC
nr:MAG TPA: hypothetical protein [Caudoviricetes sp.]